MKRCRRRCFTARLARYRPCARRHEIEAVPSPNRRNGKINSQALSPQLAQAISRSTVANTLNVELVAVEEKVWTGQATMLVARTTEGELGVMAGHAPLLGQLADPGSVRIKRDDNSELEYQVNGGFLSVTGTGVTVLAESCQFRNEKKDGRVVSGSEAETASAGGA